MAHHAVVRDAGADVAGAPLGHVTQRSQRRKIGQMPQGLREGRRATGPVERTRGLAHARGGLFAELRQARARAGCAQREDLGQDRAVLGHGGKQRGVIVTRVGEDDIQDLLARAQLGDLLDQAGLRASRPGPGADFGE